MGVFGIMALSQELSSGLTCVGGEGPFLFPGACAESCRSEPASPLFHLQVGWAKKCGWGCSVNCFPVSHPPRNQSGEFPGDPPGWGLSSGQALGGPGNAQAELGLGFPGEPAQMSRVLFLGIQHCPAHSGGSGSKVLEEGMHGGNSPGNPLLCVVSEDLGTGRCLVEPHGGCGVCVCLGQGVRRAE